MDKHITTESLPGTEIQAAEGGQNVPAADGNLAGLENTPSQDGAAENVVEVKDLMKQIIGKDFPDNDTAIKSLKDTYAYVGQMGQKVKTLEQENTELKQSQVSPEIAAQLQSLRQQVKDATFYAQHPEYNTPEAKSLITKFGSDPEAVIQDEVFQKAFTAIKTTAEMEKTQSVLHTNPRLGVAQDNMTKAVEAQKAGNDAEAANNAVAAVLELMK